jgi:hypothetical protein
MLYNVKECNRRVSGMEGKVKSSDDVTIPRVNSFSHTSNNESTKNLPQKIEMVVIDFLNI